MSANQIYQNIKRMKHPNHVQLIFKLKGDLAFKYQQYDFLHKREGEKNV